MTRRFLIVGFSAAMVVVLGACDLLGGDDDDDNGAPQYILSLDYTGATGDGGYETDVVIRTDEALLDANAFELNDASDSRDVDAGTYTLNLTSRAPDTMRSVQIFEGTNEAVTQATYAATNDTLSDFIVEWGFTPTEYDQITAGTVEVSISGSEYTFTWNLTTADSATITGSYTGAVDELYFQDSREIELNTDYTGESITALDDERYTFIAGSTADHTVSVTNVASDVSLDVFSDEFVMVIAASDSSGLANEIANVSLLTPGDRYWLRVDELDNVDSSFDLRIDN